MSTLLESAKSVLRDISKDSFYFLKIIAPILLIVSFIMVLNEYFKLQSGQILSEYFRQALAVPLILFGIMAMLNIMLFVQPGACMFLALFFIGTVVSGPELAEKGAKIAAATFSNSMGQYAEALGGISTQNYIGEGGLDGKKTEGNGPGNDISKDIESKDKDSNLNTSKSTVEKNEKK